MDGEVELAGGNASGRVVRVAGTVRKPWTASTPAVHQFLRALRAGGVDVPDPIGRDDDGRQVLEFVPGAAAMPPDLLDASGLRRVGRLVRTIHDVGATYEPPTDAVWDTAIPAPGGDLVCHNDLAPWNLVIGERWVFIDWDAAAPSTRLWDLAYSAQAFCLNDPSSPPGGAAERLAAFVGGYSADGGLREALPRTMAERCHAMHDHLQASWRDGQEPWASMHVAGHGEHWAAKSDYVERHSATWAATLLP